MESTTPIQGFTVTFRPSNIKALIAHYGSIEEAIKMEQEKVRNLLLEIHQGKFDHENPATEHAVFDGIGEF